MHDKIIISELQLPVLIGTNPEERLNPQLITFNLTLFGDLSVAGDSDDLNDTVDYFTFSQKVTDFILNSKYFLLEALAENIAKLALQDPRVLGITVNIRKPNVIPNAKASILEITRFQA